MADTRQNVQWTLERKCLLRSTEESAHDPSTAAKCVGEVRAYSRGLRNREHGFGVYGDVYVSSYTTASAADRKPGDRPHYPASGFIISEKFGRFGGPEALFSMCHQCPANTRPYNIAECVGHLYQRPGYPETEEQLRGIISRLDLQDEMATHFPPTTPLWYGLWAVSPVPVRALPFLKILLSEMLREDREDFEARCVSGQQHLDQFSSIISAIELALSRNLTLHVRLLPLGHTDFGIYTIFPHCSFCKATADVRLWQRKYPADLRACEVCGSRFSPAETASATRCNFELEELRDTLGNEAFRVFARDYLIVQGETAEDAGRIVEETEAAEIKRQEKLARNRELQRLKDFFLEKHVFTGLECTPAPPSELMDDEESVDPSRSTRWFNAPAFVEVLRRCSQLGIKVTYMSHRSVNEELDRSSSFKIKAPLELFETWKSEGCAEKFHANCIVPDELIKADSI